MGREKWTCIFKDPFTKEQVNPRLAELNAPIGAFTRVWRWEHCATINPYGSEGCPYEPADCAMAYLKTGQDAMEAHTSKVGYFKILAKRRGIDRADNKPLARDKVRTDGLSDGEADLRDGPRAGPGDVLGVGLLRGTPTPPREPSEVAGDRAVGLRRAAPRSIGSLLFGGDGEGSRTRARRGNEGEESPDNDGDTGDPVSPPPPGRLGNESPS